MRKLLYMQFLLSVLWAIVAGLEFGQGGERPISAICAVICSFIWWLNWMFRIYEEDSTENE